MSPALLPVAAAGVHTDGGAAAPGPQSDVALLEDFCAGDAAGFEALVRRLQPGLQRYFRRRLRDEALAEDLTQEVFLRVYTHRLDYEPRAKFTAYLYRIARNCWIDQVRRVRGARRGRSLDAATEDGPALGETLPVRGEDPRASVERDDLEAALVLELDRLPEEHRSVFLLSEVEGLPYRDISRRLEIPLGTVKSRMFHAVKRLRDRLAG